MVAPSGWHGPPPPGPPPPLELADVERAAAALQARIATARAELTLSDAEGRYHELPAVVAAERAAAAAMLEGDMGLGASVRELAALVQEVLQRRASRRREQTEQEGATDGSAAAVDTAPTLETLAAPDP